MYIKRHITNIISEDLKGFPSALLTGPRQVGKGGVICSYDSLMPLDGNNMVIPVGML